MAAVLSWKTCYPALVIQPKLHHFQICACRFRARSNIQTEAGRIQHCTRKIYPLFVSRNPDSPTSVDDDSDPERFWSNIIKQAYWVVKSLLEFLAEQPSQLKYIEWPTHQSTLKTATLTLILVGLLIISLSSVDAALYYIFALLSRRRA